MLLMLRNMNTRQDQIHVINYLAFFYIAFKDGDLSERVNLRIDMEYSVYKSKC